MWWTSLWSVVVLQVSEGCITRQDQILNQLSSFKSGTLFSPLPSHMPLYAKPNFSGCVVLFCTHLILCRSYFGGKSIIFPPVVATMWFILSELKNVVKVCDSNPVHSLQIWQIGLPCPRAVCSVCALKKTPACTQSWLCRWETSIVARTKPWRNSSETTRCIRSTEVRGIMWLVVEPKYQQPLARIMDSGQMYRINYSSIQNTVLYFEKYFDILTTS